MAKPLQHDPILSSAKRSGSGSQDAVSASPAIRPELHGLAHGIADDLVDEFGEGSVFFDSETLVPGHGLTKEIQANLANSTHVLVVIGPDWLMENSETGEVRITEKDDWVRAELSAALTVFGAALVAGFLYYLVDGLVDLLRGAYLAISQLENKLDEASYEIGQLRRADEITDGKAAEVVFDYESASKTKLPYWVQGQFIADNAKLFNGGLIFVTYFGLIIYGALRAARGYVSIPTDRIFPVVASAAAAYLVVSVVYHGPIKFWVDPSQTVELMLFWIGSETVRWAAFCGALAISLRRPLRLKRDDIVLMILIAAISSGLTKYLVSWTAIPPSTWIAAIEWTGLSQLYDGPGGQFDGIEYAQFTRVLYGSVPDPEGLWVNKILNGHPVCFANGVLGASRSAMT